MGVFDLIRAMLGLGGSDNSSTTDVPIEPERRETGGPETNGSDEPDTGPDSGRESVASGTDATASTDPMIETPSPDADTAAEPAEAGDGATEHSGTETPATEAAEAADPTPDEASVETDASGDGSDTTSEDAASEDVTNEDVADDADAVSVETISGIGPAYAERLADAGVETVPQLLDADPSELAEATDLSEKRIAGWLEDAGE